MTRNRSVRFCRSGMLSIMLIYQLELAHFKHKLNLEGIYEQNMRPLYLIVQRNGKIAS